MSELSYCANVKNEINSKLPKKSCCLKVRRISAEIFNDPCKTEGALSDLLNLPKCDGCSSELLKMAFLYYGSLTDPAKGRHLEFIAHSEFEREFLKKLLCSCGFSPKLSDRNGYFTCYFKDGDIIKDVFGKMGVNSVVFDVLNSKMMGEIRNSTNRLVNFETAKYSEVYRSIGKIYRSYQRT